MRFAMVFLVVFGCLGTSPAIAQNLDSREILNAGVQAFKASKYAEAVEYFKKAVQLDPEFPTARLYLATAYMSQFVPGVATPENNGFAQSALEQFRKVFDMDPKNLIATQSITSIY